MVTIAQSQFQIWTGGNLGGALYKQDFGFGDTDVAVAAPSLAPGLTSFPYSNNVCPPEGSYSIVQKVNVNNCSSGKWLLISNDHNPSTSHGNMMLVHNTPSQQFRTAYVDTIYKDLCAGTIYEFSAAIINIDAAANCSDFPEITFTLEDISGTPVASYTTPTIVASPPGTSAGGLWKYSVYGFDYTMPSNRNSLVIKISLRASANNTNCNNDFAIDDITFSPVGPAINITFDGRLPEVTVTGLCFQDNKTISMAGVMDPFYSNPAFQWEYSNNAGATWTDIAGANSDAYSQMFNIADTFLFRLRGSDVTTINKQGCGSVSNQLKVEVDDLPVNYTVSSNSPVCAGSNLQFNASGGASYVWTGPNGFYDNIQMPHIFTSIFADSGTYYAQIVSFGGCKVIDSTRVRVIGIDEVAAGNDTLICKGGMAYLHATTGAAYEWFPANTLSSSTIQNPVAKPNDATIYIVKVSSVEGCSDTASVKVNFLNSFPVKSVITAPDYICFPVDTVNFINASSENIETTFWNFDNGQGSNLKNPLPQIYDVDLSRKDYRVSLAVTDSSGCADTSYHTLKVESNCYIAVPTAFTPNGDGLNDYLYPLNAYKATDLSFKVYNRLGELVFQTRDWTKKWNGSFNNEPQAAGIYVWTLHYIDTNKKNISLKGSTMLLR